MRRLTNLLTGTLTATYMYFFPIQNTSAEENFNKNKEIELKKYDYQTPESTLNSILIAFERGDLVGIRNAIIENKEIEPYEEIKENKYQREYFQEHIKDLYSKIKITPIKTEIISDTEIKMTLQTEFYEDKEKTKSMGKEIRIKKFILQKNEWKIESI